MALTATAGVAAVPAVPAVATSAARPMSAAGGTTWPTVRPSPPITPARSAPTCTLAPARPRAIITTAVQRLSRCRCARCGRRPNRWAGRTRPWADGIGPTDVPIGIGRPARAIGIGATGNGRSELGRPAEGRPSWADRRRSTNAAPVADGARTRRCSRWRRCDEHRVSGPLARPATPRPSWSAGQPVPPPASVSPLEGPNLQIS